jgi:Flp pilus assembly protein TadB
MRMPLSPGGALILALGALLLLACLAGWLLNVPVLAIGAFAAIGVLLIRGAYRQLAKRRARQDTEA